MLEKGEREFETVILCSPDDPPASAPQVLGFQVCAMHSFLVLSFHRAKKLARGCVAGSRGEIDMWIFLIQGLHCLSF